MAKLNRIVQKIFGSTAGVNQIGKFGSFAAGSPEYTTDPAEVQTSNYLTGWFGAIIGNASPCIEDMNSIFFFFSRQLAYVMQAGIPEYNSETSYHIGSLVNSNGAIYVSLVDDNLGNALTDFTKWAIQGNTFRNVTTTDVATIADNILRCSASGGSFVETLPPAATSKYKKLIVKVVSTGGDTVTLKGNGTELIDFENTLVLRSGDSATIFCNGVSWDIL